MTKQDWAKREMALVTWQDVQKGVAKVNAELASLVDNINPDQTHKLVKVTYFYGDEVVKNSRTFFPGEDDNLVEITHHSIDPKIQQELSYSSIPLFLSLDKSTTSFFDTGKRHVPNSMVDKGTLIGLYQEMDQRIGRESSRIDSFCAGACSSFLLPKITDRTGLKKLQQAYNIAPTIEIDKLSDHCKLFKYIAQSNKINNKWQSTILFFGKSFMRKKSASQAEITFKNFLVDQAWKSIGLTINRLVFNMLWEKYTSIISSRKPQLPLHILFQVKHLLSLMIGNFPAFTVSSNNEEVAPTNALQEAFIEHYSLKEYIPTIMSPYTLKSGEKNPRYIYYSLSNPTVMEGTALKENSNTIINDLREIKDLIETLKSQLDIKDSHHFHKIIRNTNIDFFHPRSDDYHKIRSSENIGVEDPSFLQDSERFKDRKFCATSPFFSGCIRIEVPPSSTKVEKINRA
jgi:hypothetical protein